jgi:hypothetical protein
VAATQGAMETAHARRQAQDGSVEAEAGRLADGMAALEALKGDLAVLPSGSTLLVQKSEGSSDKAPKAQS